ncbi:E3 ubiquitin-protein ligase TRIM45-like [Mytilus trossulus]|uniref:E3 ubiquitin-protein ligase TRIM45-like n=1 Tax=Mytilus trossulus TaxID=6551 RepID=UPI003003C49B
MAQAASKTCEICVSAPGSQYCLDCEQLYCENCKSLHQRQKLSTNHQFQNASELIPEGKSRCSQHTEEFTLMCNTCNVPVCTSCVTGKHNKHEFSKFVDAIAQLRGYNETKIRAKTNQADQNITKIEDSLTSFDNDVESVIKAITDQSNNIKRMVDKSVAQMIALVKEQSKKEKDKLTKSLSAAKAVLVAGQNIDKRRQDLDKTRPDETMVQQINKIKEEINKLNINPLLEFPKISFDSKVVTEDDIRQLIGTYTVSGCSPVEKKEKQQHGFLFRCPICGRERIGPNSDFHHLRRKLLEKGMTLTLANVRSIAKAMEDSERQAKSIEGQGQVNMIQSKGQALLSRNTAEQLGVLQLVHSVSEPGTIKDKYPECFGKLKSFQLQIPIDPDVEPIIQPMRRVPFYLCDKVGRKFLI